jgi:hypothetical protein
MTNSQYAFKMNIDVLVDNIPLRDKRSLYFWTFTAPEVITPKEFKRRWNHFLTNLKRTFPKVPWIRVFELHPGDEGDWNGHGLHIHAVTNHYLDVDMVRKVAQMANLGRIHAKRIPHGRASNYLAKYLDKTKRSQAPILKGMRLWQTINFEDLKVLVKNIVRYTFKSWLMRGLGPLGGEVRKYIYDHNKTLAERLWLKVGIKAGFRRWKAINEYIDNNSYELAQTLIKPYNDFRACNNLNPMYVY